MTARSSWRWRRRYPSGQRRRTTRSRWRTSRSRIWRTTPSTVRPSSESRESAEYRGLTLGRSHEPEGTLPLMTTQELVAAAGPKIGRLGSSFHFVAETTAQGEKLGLDVFEFYFVGRGGVLGDVEARVVTSAFGFFKPQLVEAMWNTARTKISPRDAGRAYLECAREWGRAHLSHLGGELDAFCKAAEAVNAAADPVGLSLYAGASAEPL